MRRPERVPFSTPAALIWQDASGASKFVRGHCRDISEAGIRVELAEPIPLQTYVIVNAPKIPLTVDASVRHCSNSRGKYVIGLEFSCPIKNLAEHLAKESQSARQRTPR